MGGTGNTTTGASACSSLDVEHEARKGNLHEDFRLPDTKAPQDATTVLSQGHARHPKTHELGNKEPLKMKILKIIREHPRVTSALILLLVLLVTVSVAVALAVAVPRKENLLSSIDTDLSSNASSSTLAPAPASVVSSSVPSSTESTPTLSPLSTSPSLTMMPVSMTSYPISASVTYQPGNLSLSMENQLYLSQGLSSKIIANTGMPVQYPTLGGSSDINCHSKQDFGATFLRPGNEGGWIYVSNSEDVPYGGVGAFTFDSDGNVIDYRMVLTETRQNCGGGKTPWEAWISCEERNGGRCYQVDPTGQREAQMITMGEETDGGLFESFAYWIADETAPQFFITEDVNNGTVRRWIPDSPDWSDPWNILIGSGAVDYLVVDPSTMTYRYTTDLTEARVNAREQYPGTEGIDEYRDHLYIISKSRKVMLVLSLLDGTYTEESTVIGRFDGEPDQIARLKMAEAADTIYFAEDNDETCGIFARNANGTYAVLNTPERDDDSTTGFAFSPDGKHMYVAIQNAGILYDIWRDDGLSFGLEPPNIVYEQVGVGT